MEVKAKLNNLRIGPKKVRLAADFVRGMKVDEAIFNLKYLNKKSSPYIVNLIESAIANAVNNFNLKRQDLFIKYIFVDEGITLKRWRPRAFGRAGAIRKRSSQINIVLAEKNDIDESKSKSKIKGKIKHKNDKEKSKTN